MVSLSLNVEFFLMETKGKLVRSLATVVACGALSAIAVVSCAKSDSISEVDKSRIEKIVHDYLLNNPQILVEVSKKLQQQQQEEMKEMEKKAQKSIPKLAKSLFNSDTSPGEGRDEAAVTVVEFFDYQCPHCKDMTEVTDAVLKNNSDVRVVYKEFPIFGNNSMEASRAALAAAKQGKYKEMHEALMTTSNPLNEKKILEAAKAAGVNVKQLKADMESEAVRKELEQNLMLSQKLGLLGTPAFVIGSTEKGESEASPAFFVPGAATQEMLQAYVEQVRQGN